MKKHFWFILETKYLRLLKISLFSNPDHWNELFFQKKIVVDLS